jgi:hypothetical protein
MTTKPGTKLRKAQASPFSLEPTSKRVPALRYENLSSVLVNLEKWVDEPPKRKRDGKPSVEARDIKELRAHVAYLKAESELLAERLTDKVDRLAERITELEARANRPWWHRTFGVSTQMPESAGRARSKAIARLRAISRNEAAAEPGPT